MDAMPKSVATPESIAHISRQIDRSIVDVVVTLAETKDHLDWELLGDPLHGGIKTMVGDLNRAYKDNSALWTRDNTPEGFSWIDADDRGGNIFSWLRYDGDGQMIACIINFSSEPHQDHQIGLPTEGVWKEILNTDAEVYDGTGMIGNLGQVVAHPVPSHGYRASASVTIPPLGAVWLRLETELDEEQAIEPEKATRAVRAVAKMASPMPPSAQWSSTVRTRPVVSAAWSTVHVSAAVNPSMNSAVRAG